MDSAENQTENSIISKTSVIRKQNFHQADRCHNFFTAQFLLAETDNCWCDKFGFLEGAFILVSLEEYGSQLENFSTFSEADSPHYEMYSDLYEDLKKNDAIYQELICQALKETINSTPKIRTHNHWNS